MHVNFDGIFFLCVQEDTLKKKGRIIYYFFQTSMKKHLLVVQYIFNKYALMLSRKGNLFCIAPKNRR